MRIQALLVSGGGSHFIVILQEALECLFGFFVFDPSLLFLLLLCLNLVGIKGLLLLTQLGQGTAKIHTHRALNVRRQSNKGRLNLSIHFNVCSTCNEGH